jgi:hypothetical protein
VAQPKLDIAVQPELNEEFQWDSFDSDWYLQHNYGTLRDDDRLILERMAEFFAGLDQPARLFDAIDVGTGTNLYPILAMLPLCGRITLHERATTNCQWLQDERVGYSSIWDPYWDVLADRPLYKRISQPRWTLYERTHVSRGSIFDLRPRSYDMGTMFFVAESITTRDDEFSRATQRFLRSLKPNSPFAAAFMRNSDGYEVNGVHFPAVAITEEDVQKCLDGEGIRRAHVEKIDSANPLREGVGMVLVTGRTRR